MTKTTTTIDIDNDVLAEFSYLVTKHEKPRKRNDIIQEFMEGYIEIKSKKK